MEDSYTTLRAIAQAIFDKKGFNILALDIRNISSITDCIIIAEGNVDRHLKALANEIERVLKEEGQRPVHVEGKQSGDWIVLDYSNFIIHLFLPEVREKYQLERLWAEGEIVDLEIDVSRESV